MKREQMLQNAAVLFAGLQRLQADLRDAKKFDESKEVLNMALRLREIARSLEQTASTEQ